MWRSARVWFLGVGALFLAASGAHAADNAAVFDGSEDWISLGAIDPGEELTFEAWIELDSVLKMYS